MTRIRRTIDITRIEATPITRTSRTKIPESQTTSLHCWPLRDDYSHIAVRINGRRTGSGARIARQSFRLVMKSSSLDRIEASRTFCIEMPQGEVETTALVELPTAMTTFFEDDTYLLEIHNLGADNPEPVIASYMRFYDIAGISVLASKVYLPESAFFTERNHGEDDEPSRYIECDKAYLNCHIRLMSKLDKAPIMMPEIVAKVMYASGATEEMSPAITNVKPSESPDDGNNHVEIRIPVSFANADFAWIELRAMGHTFCNILGRRGPKAIGGMIPKEYIEFGSVDMTELLKDCDELDSIVDRRNEALSATESDELCYENDLDLALDEFIGCCGTCYEEEMEDEAFAPNNEEETATAEEKDKEEEDFMGSAAAKTPIDELNGMVGLEEVKTKVQSVANVMKFFRMRKVKRLKVKPISLHSLFLGAPGTGKTTVARQMGRIMKECGVLSSGHVVEKDRSHLVGQYYSSTHENTLKAIEEARGGVLFIDEAYQLHAPEDPKDPGHDVLDTLMGVLSDESERDLMVILAGYTEKTLEMLELNPGMKSRFPECNHYRFADYSPEELLRIAEDYFLREEYLLTPEARYRLATRLEHDHRRAGQDFANGRHVITLIENRIIPSMAARATMSIGRGTIDEELLMTVLPEDIP